jgi:YHS domain-containing protein
MLRVLLIGVLLILIARAFWRVVDGVIAGASGAPRRGARTPAAVKLVRDPICGTFVAPRTALSASAGGQTHYFCSEACRQKFRA